MSDLTFSTSDFRSSTQDSKRTTNRKHKWHLGSTQRVGTALGNARPHRPSETYFSHKRHETKRAVASLAHGTKIARKHDMLEGAATNTSSSEDSSASNSEGDEGKPSSSPPDAGVMYSFDAPRGPSRGSEILNVALAKAVVKFEEKETVKLVKNEYDVVDFDAVDGVASSSVKKGKGKAKAGPIEGLVEDEEEYEFV